MRRRCKLGASEGYHSLLVLPVNTPLPVAVTRHYRAMVVSGPISGCLRAPWRRRPVGPCTLASQARRGAIPRPSDTASDGTQAAAGGHRGCSGRPTEQHHDGSRFRRDAGNVLAALDRRRSTLAWSDLNWKYPPRHDCALFKLGTCVVHGQP